MKLSLESLAVFSRSPISATEGARSSDLGDAVRERSTVIASNLIPIAGGGAPNASEVRRVVARRGAKRVVQPQSSPRSASRLLSEIEDVG